MNFHPWLKPVAYLETNIIWQTGRPRLLSWSYHMLTSRQITSGMFPLNTTFSQLVTAITLCFVQCIRLKSQLRYILWSLGHQYKGLFTVLILGNRSDEVLCGQERCWDVKCLGMKSFGQMPLSIWDQRKQPRAAFSPPPHPTPPHCSPPFAHSHNHPCYFLL